MAPYYQGASFLVSLETNDATSRNIVRTRRGLSRSSRIAEYAPSTNATTSHFDSEKHTQNYTISNLSKVPGEDADSLVNERR